MKALFVTLAASLMFVLSGCTAAPIGYDAVKSAKEKYETLDSARVVMEDISTGARLMEFTFRINKRDEMEFTYSDGKNSAYSDGAEFFYRQDGEEKWTVIGPSDENYVYNVYNRSYRYPYAQGSIFFLDGTSVESGSVVGVDGDTVVTYVYDANRLNKNAVSILDNVSSFSSLTAEYRINNDGYPVSFTESGRVIDADGNESSVDIRITIYDMNGVDFIEKPDTIL